MATCLATVPVTVSLVIMAPLVINSALVTVKSVQGLENVTAVLLDGEGTIANVKGVLDRGRIALEMACVYQLVRAPVILVGLVSRDI